MKIIKQKINVEFHYDIFFTENAFLPENTILRDVVDADSESVPRKAVFMIEQNVADHHPDLMEHIDAYRYRFPKSIDGIFPPLIISGGESEKSFASIEPLCAKFAEYSLCRHSFAVLIGGGAFLDFAGLAASLVHRGLRQIRFPTTTLSQCDSGVGVKTGINMSGIKNCIGTFAPPYAVINDFSFLDTLEFRDWIAGIPEAFKVAMIKDADFFNWLCDNSAKFAEREPEAMKQLVEKCAVLHLQHIASAGDPYESASARPLDFGHWAAHKLEMMTGGAVRHGEAVAVGLLLDTYYAVKTGLIEEELLNRLVKAFASLGFKLFYPELAAEAADGSPLLLQGIDDFRVHLGGELHITLPDGLGAKTEVGKLDSRIILEGIKFLKDINTKN